MNIKWKKKKDKTTITKAAAPKNTSVFSFLSSDQLPLLPEISITATAHTHPATQLPRNQGNIEAHKQHHR